LTQQVIETFGRIPTPREFIKACTMVDSAPTMQEAAKAILQNWPEPLTVGDAMSASHPSAPAVLKSYKDALDDIAQSVQAHRNGKHGMIDGIEDLLKKFGYKFV
jgi:hypothetical protein